MTSQGQGREENTEGSATETKKRPNLNLKSKKSHPSRRRERKSVAVNYLKEKYKPADMFAGRETKQQESLVHAC